MQSQRKEIRPTQGEAPFDQGEVFYSRTDKRGVLISGNYIFQRVAHYDWDELIGAPHKIIRHPDMPKGVFHLMWERMKQDKIVGAYVKNRAKDGLHYWVFAVVTPLPEGYVSTRFKPCSARLSAIQDLYAKALKRENETDITPEQSAAWIIAQILEMGFETYEDFAADALSEELTAESEALGLKPDKRIAKSREMIDVTKALVAGSGELFEEFTILASIPKNMQIKSSLLEPTGGPLTALSKNYGHMSDEISDRFTNQVFGQDNNFAKISECVKEAMLLNNAAEILRRCDAQLLAERRTLGSFDLTAERNRLSTLADDYRAKATTASTEIVLQCTKINIACQDISRILLALQTVCVNCKIENACLGENAGSLDMIIDQLTYSQARVEYQLRTITGLIDQVLEAAGSDGLLAERQIDDVLLYGEKMAAAISARGGTAQVLSA